MSAFIKMSSTVKCRLPEDVGQKQLQTFLFKKTPQKHMWMRPQSVNVIMERVYFGNEISVISIPPVGQIIST